MIRPVTLAFLSSEDSDGSVRSHLRRVNFPTKAQAGAAPGEHKASSVPLSTTRSPSYCWIGKRVSPPPQGHVLYKLVFEELTAILRPPPPSHLVIHHLPPSSHLVIHRHHLTEPFSWVLMYSITSEMTVITRPHFTPSHLPHYIWFSSLLSTMYMTYDGACLGLSVGCRNLEYSLLLA